MYVYVPNNTARVAGLFRNHGSILREVATYAMVAADTGVGATAAALAFFDKSAKATEIFS